MFVSMPDYSDQILALIRIAILSSNLTVVTILLHAILESNYSSICAGINCHGQCVEENGCWGTFPDECITCRSYRFSDICVDTCNLSISIPLHDQRECIPLTTDNLPAITTTTSNPDSISSNISTIILFNSSTNTTTIGDHMITNTVKVVPHLVTDERLLVYTISTVAFLLLTLLVVVIVIFSVLLYRRRKKRKVSLPDQQKCCPTSSGVTVEKYSQNKDETKTILVTPAGDRDASSAIMRRSTNISLSSLASASFQLEDEKSYQTDRRESLQFIDDDSTYAPQKNHMIIPPPPYDSHQSGAPSFTENYVNELYPSPMAITRRSSPQGHIPTTNNSSTSFYTSNSGDTGYNSRKPSLGGSRASSTSLQRPMTMGGTTGRVYSTRQPQLNHYRHHNHYGMESHRDSLASYGTGAASARTSISNDNQFGSSTISRSSGGFAINTEKD